MILMRDDSDGSGVVFTVVAGFFFFGLRNNLFYDFIIIKKKKKKNLSRFGRGFTAAIQGQWTEWPHWKQNFKDKNDNWLKLKKKELK